MNCSAFFNVFFFHIYVIRLLLLLSGFCSINKERIFEWLLSPTHFFYKQIDLTEEISLTPIFYKKISLQKIVNF